MAEETKAAESGDQETAGNEGTASKRRRRRTGKNSVNKKTVNDPVELAIGKMPNGKTFEVRFVPASGVNAGLQGFMIHGLERTKYVKRQPQQFGRKELKLILETVAKEAHQVDVSELLCFKVE